MNRDGSSVAGRRAHWGQFSSQAGPPPERGEMAPATRNVERRRGMLLFLVLSPIFIALGNGPALAHQAQVTREMLVAEAERAPGSTKGHDDAPITIVEFSDFQCSFCRKFWKETLPKIEAEYVATGKARFIFRHLAVLGPVSERAAEAAECARDQGKFWAYHDRLYEKAGRFGFTEPQLMEDLRMDRVAMEACIASGRHADRILRETSLARRLGANGTPTFLINDKLLIGAHPFETFKRMLDALGTGRSDPANPEPTPTPRP
jgi:protein-disulfide isomerase